MRYILLLFFTTFLFISCGNENGTANANNKTLTSTVKQKAKKNPKKRKAKNTGYWGFMKKNAGLTDSQTKQLMAITNKKAKTVKDLKKQKKWAGKANTALRKNVASKNEKEMKAILGGNWSKWKAANNKWKASRKKKKVVGKKKKAKK